MGRSKKFSTKDGIHIGGYVGALVAILYLGPKSCEGGLLTGTHRGNATLELREGFNGNRDTLLVHQEKEKKTDIYLVESDTLKINDGTYDMWLKNDGASTFWLQGREYDRQSRSDVFDVTSANLDDVLRRTAIPNYETPFIGDMFLQHLPK